MGVFLAFLRLVWLPFFFFGHVLTKNGLIKRIQREKKINLKKKFKKNPKIQKIACEIPKSALISSNYTTQLGNFFGAFLNRSLRFFGTFAC
jgi:hypothetical protein